MTDTVIKGTGNSRSIRSVPNIAALAPTYDKLLELLAGEGLPVDIGGLNPIGVQTMGDDLNKANLLTDALCTALGLDTTATPTQAMDKLRTLINSVDSEKASVVRGSYTGTGVIGASNGTAPSNPKSLTFSSPPKCIIITTDWGSYDWVLLVLMQGITQSGSLFREQYSQNTLPITSYRVLTTWSGNKVSWYTYGWRNDANDAKASANTSGKQYNYIAIL